jgi:hypothetical protein
MVEEITNCKAPIAVIPQAQLVLRALNILRRSRSRLRKKESIEQNEREQGLIKQRLIDMGRQDLINY